MEGQAGAPPDRPQGVGSATFQYVIGNADQHSALRPFPVNPDPALRPGTGGGKVRTGDAEYLYSFAVATKSSSSKNEYAVGRRPVSVQNIVQSVMEWQLSGEERAQRFISVRAVEPRGHAGGGTVPRLSAGPGELCGSLGGAAERRLRVLRFVVRSGSSARAGSVAQYCVC